MRLWHDSQFIAVGTNGDSVRELDLSLYSQFLKKTKTHYVFFYLFITLSIKHDSKKNLHGR